MDVLEQILSEPSAYDELQTSIDANDSNLISGQLAKFRVQYPHLELAPALLYCIERQNLETLLLFLENGIKPDDFVVEAAARMEDLTYLAPLLDNGWPIDQPLRNGAMPSLLWTPLSIAVREGTMQAVQMLLDAGGDVTKGDLLHCAVERAPSETTVELIELLVSLGAHVDAIEFQAPEARELRHAFPRGTALHHACYMQNELAVSTLLELGASRTCPQVSRVQGENYTPFDAARASGQHLIVEMIRGITGDCEFLYIPAMRNVRLGSKDWLRVGVFRPIFRASDKFRIYSKSGPEVYKAFHGTISRKARLLGEVEGCGDTFHVEHACVRPSSLTVCAVPSSVPRQPQLTIKVIGWGFESDMLDIQLDSNCDVSEGVKIDCRSFSGIAQCRSCNSTSIIDVSSDNVSLSETTAGFETGRRQSYKMLATCLRGICCNTDAGPARVTVSAAPASCSSLT
nr:hypothetical protein CFP56_71323 [Quercus suber]